jgi:hypothetical protein
MVTERFDPAKDIYNFERVLADETRLQERDGTAHLSGRPAIGIEFDETAIARYGTVISTV